MSAEQIDQTDPAKEKIINRVRRLLAKADRAENESEHEIQVCMDKVQALLMEHKIDMMEVHGAHYEKGESVGGKVTHGYVKMGVGQVSNFNWCRLLGQGIAQSCYCRRLWVAKRRELLFVGTDEDVKIACELYVHFSTEMKLLCKVARQRASIKATTSQGNKFFNDYMYGCAYRLWQRLENQRKEVEARTTALVRITEEANTSYIAELLKPRSYQEKQLIQSAAMVQGMKDADKIALQRVPGGERIEG